MNTRFVVTASALIVALITGVTVSAVGQTSTPAPASQTTSRGAAGEPSRISPDQAYRANCLRCHSELPKLDPRAMKTVLRHMRIRANMPPDEARAVLAYLTR